MPMPQATLVAANCSTSTDDAQQPLMTIIIFLEAMKTPKHHWTECKTSLVVAAVKKKK
jgi:hypothetical protein